LTKAITVISGNRNNYSYLVLPNHFFFGHVCCLAGTWGQGRQCLTEGNVDITFINSKSFTNSPHY